MHWKWAHLARPQPFTLMKFHRSLSTRMLAGAKCLKIGMDLMGKSCHSRPIRQNSAEILLRANLIQPPSPISSFPFIFGVSKHPHAFIPFHSYSCILFIHPFIGWPGSFRFCTFILENPIKIWNFISGRAHAAYHPMNSLAPSKALLSGRPLAILGNLNGLLWVFYEEGEETHRH